MHTMVFNNTFDAFDRPYTLQMTAASHTVNAPSVWPASWTAQHSQHSTAAVPAETPVIG